HEDGLFCIDGTTGLPRSIHEETARLLSCQEVDLDVWGSISMSKRTEQEHQDSTKNCYFTQLQMC
ncbi:unnamed protein product, partial [Amoebophrya sp. A25]